MRVDDPLPARQEGIVAPILDFLRSAAPVRPATVGITGPVAVGKSHVAAQLRRELDHAGGAARTIVACTDAWLLDEATLLARGLSARKGFPESYDVPAMRAALETAETAGVIRSPRYSHLLYDIEPDVVDEQVVGEWLVVEGLHLTRFVRDLVPVIVHLDAPDAVIEEWYVRRLIELIERARNGEPSFYASFTGYSEKELDDIARAFWHGINLPNKHEFIDPFRSAADLLVTLDVEHRVASITRGDRESRGESGDPSQT